MTFRLIIITVFCTLGLVSCGRESEPATPLETFKTYTKAIKQKDATTMKLLLSTESIKMHEQEAKARNVTLDDIVKSQTLVTEDQRTLEFRNEKIEGEKATLEVKSFGGWETVPFVLEGAEWKIDTKEYADRFGNDVEQMNQTGFEAEYNKGRVP